MDTKENTSNEQKIWDLYEQKCREDGTKPSVKGFKDWTTSLLKKL